ncbi:unnamed protein product [Rotaria sp. Silwood1]|nr:unnamed protein product [Rotaria sp. Silwood1]
MIYFSRTIVLAAHPNVKWLSGLLKQPWRCFRGLDTSPTSVMRNAQVQTIYTETINVINQGRLEVRCPFNLYVTPIHQKDFPRLDKAFFTIYGDSGFQFSKEEWNTLFKFSSVYNPDNRHLRIDGQFTQLGAKKLSDQAHTLEVYCQIPPHYELDVVCTDNNNVNVEYLHCPRVHIQTKQGECSLKNIVGDSIVVHSQNGNITCYGSLHGTIDLKESFAALIGIIFIYEAFDKMIEINKKQPVQLHTTALLPPGCTCIRDNIALNRTRMTISACYKNKSYEFIGECGDAYNKVYTPDVFFFSILLFVSTFVLAYTLKNFKFSRFLPMGIRSKVSDFGVVIAIFLNVFFDNLIGLDTPKLSVPQKFATTKEGRGWIINPFGKNPMVMWFAALLPALLATILIFMDQQITAVIINRKENKLKKGCGYHLDLLIVALCIGINSILGLPWFVAATVLSINHVIALKLESETAAPGEKPKFLGVREQRLTGFIVFLFIGLSVFLTKLLAFIPMPVLYGVFLYMGISSMKEIQLISRILLIFMPEKYQPDYVYLRHVRTRRVHLFTLIQLSCLAMLWIIKSIKRISILFPIMVLALVGARKVMDYLFTQRELEYLDDIMPEVVKKEIEERKNSIIEDTDENGKKTSDTITLNNGEIRIPVGHGQVMKVPTENVKIDTSTGVINFSEEVGKTFLWRSIATTKDKEPSSEGKLHTPKQPTTDKPSRGSALKKRIRKLSISILGPDEDRPLVTATNEVPLNPINQQLPSIVIEQTEKSRPNDNAEQRQRTSSTTSNNNDTTKM